MSGSTDTRVPLIEHVRELRARVFWSLLFVVAGAGVGYAMHDQLLRIIQRPIGQTLYYTAPTGALGFVLKVCVVFGVLLGLPVIMYHIFSFLGPLLSKKTRRQTVFFTALSLVLAVAGVLFSYFLTLPAALHFLVGFGSENVKSLITANEYFNFAFAYILGFAVLFQIPLVLLFINSIHRLPPGKLFGALRYIVVISFVGAAIITPTPDPLNQGLMALPAVALYVVSAIVITMLNALRRSKAVHKHRAPDAEPLFVIKKEYTQQLPPLPALPSTSGPPPAVETVPVTSYARTVRRRPVAQPRPVRPPAQVERRMIAQPAARPQASLRPAQNLVSEFV